LRSLNNNKPMPSQGLETHAGTKSDVRKKGDCDMVVESYLTHFIDMICMYNQ
jgi:hypothetical protein